MGFSLRGAGEHLPSQLALKVSLIICPHLALGSDSSLTLALLSLPISILFLLNAFTANLDNWPVEGGVMHGSAHFVSFLQNKARRCISCLQLKASALAALEGRWLAAF